MSPQLELPELSLTSFKGMKAEEIREIGACKLIADGVTLAYVIAPPYNKEGITGLEKKCIDVANGGLLVKDYLIRQEEKRVAMAEEQARQEKKEAALQAKAEKKQKKQREEPEPIAA